MNQNSSAKRSIDTQVIHSRGRGRYGGAALTPTFRSTVYAVPDEVGSYLDIGYPRLSTTPNQIELAETLAGLEGGQGDERALLCASGMAAISTALLGNLSKGDHLVAQDQLYGGTHALIHRDLPRFGIEVKAAPDADALRRAIRPGQTGAVYVEAMTNPLLRVIDHQAVVDAAHEAGAVAIIDSTFAPPVNFQPLELGYDLVVHSATKYLNGHSDLVAGVVVGRGEALERARGLLAHTGGVLEPGACFLLERGLKTLPLRVRRQNQSAQAIAEFLAGRGEVATVHYAGLGSHPDHESASKWMSGFGGVLSFELRGGLEAAKALTGKLELFFDGPSLGGVESLITRPAHTSHRSLVPAERERLGITAGLIRLSVGLEDPGELIADLRQGLEP